MKFHIFDMILKQKKVENSMTIIKQTKLDDKLVEKIDKMESISINLNGI